jgi:hypothetical protein
MMENVRNFMMTFGYLERKLLVMTLLKKKTIQRMRMDLDRGLEKDQERKVRYT